MSLLIINAAIFKEENVITKTIYEHSFSRCFDTYDEYRNFFLEVGTNNPNGIEVRYFDQLVLSYSNSIKRKRLIDSGLMGEVYTDDGSVEYRVLR